MGEYYDYMSKYDRGHTFTFILKARDVSIKNQKIFLITYVQRNK